MWMFQLIKQLVPKELSQDLSHVIMFIHNDVTMQDQLLTSEMDTYDSNIKSCENVSQWFAISVRMGASTRNLGSVLLMQKSLSVEFH